MKRLCVYLKGEQVGTLEQDAGGMLRFRYSPDWLGRPDATPLSRSLPLQPELFRGKLARPFFVGILPDEGPREQVARILGVSDRNDFALLERIGGECAGAVTLLPNGAPHPDRADARIRGLTEAEIERIVTELPRRPLMAGTEGLRLSLAGSQLKIPLILRDAAIALPLGSIPSTHILKPEPDQLPHPRRRLQTRRLRRTGHTQQNPRRIRQSRRTTPHHGIMAETFSPLPPVLFYHATHSYPDESVVSGP